MHNTLSSTKKRPSNKAKITKLKFWGSFWSVWNINFQNSWHYLHSGVITGIRSVELAAICEIACDRTIKSAQSISISWLNRSMPCHLATKEHQTLITLITRRPVGRVWLLLAGYGASNLPPQRQWRQRSAMEPIRISLIHSAINISID